MDKKAEVLFSSSSSTARNSGIKNELRLVTKSYHDTLEEPKTFQKIRSQMRKIFLGGKFYKG